MQTIIDLQNRTIKGYVKAGKFKEQMAQLKEYLSHAESLNLDELEVLNKR